MIGFLTTRKCASCKTWRLWAIVCGPLAVLVCARCDAPVR